MAKPIEISLVANTRAFTSGTDDAAKSLDKVADSLDDLVQESARHADRTGDNIRDGIEDGTDKAETEVERLNRSFRELATEARQQGDRAGKGIGDGVKDGADKASDGVREANDEIKSSAREGAASFSGEWNDAADFVQESLANALGGFGPIGAAAGIAAAIGLGVIVAEIEKGGDRSEEFKAKVSDLAQALIDTGERGGPGIEYVVEQLKELATTTEEGVTSLADLRRMTENVGTSFEDVARAMVAGGRDVNEVLDEQKRALQDLEEANTYDPGNFDIQSKVADQRKVVEALEQQKTAIEEAQAAEAAYIAAGGPELEAKQALIDEVADSYDAARDAAYEAATADGSFNIDDWLGFVADQKAAVEQYKANLEGMRLTADQWTNFLALPEEARQSIAASYAGAGQDGKAKIEQALSDAGSNAGAGAKVGFQESFGKPDAQVDVIVQTDQAKADVSNFVDSKRRIEIPVEASTGEAKTRLDSLIANERVAVIRTDVRTAAAYADLNNLVADRTATIRVKYVDNASGKVVVP